MLLLALWITAASARRQCPAEGATVGELRSSGRCLQSWTHLAPSLVAAQYRSQDVATVVLFESKDKRVRPVWLVQEETDIASFEKTALHRSHIVEVLSCVDGTGGCFQYFVLWQPGGDAKSIPNPRDAFNAKLPCGKTTYKAPMVDLDAMSIHGYGWGPHDANGSPSVEMTCRVTFDGESFALSRCVTRPTPASP